VSRQAFTGVRGVWLLSAVLSGCGPATDHYGVVERQMAAEQFSGADATIEKNKGGYGSRNAVLYDMDRGMTLHLSGQYAESNKYLEDAERRIEDLFTKSVTAETGAMFTNDNTLPYEGEDFEKVMINLVAALNYVQLGQPDEALVEARKVDHKLNLFNDKYQKKNIYKEDAFARYLSGILFEAKGELNDAFISYRKAYETYQDYKKFYGTAVPDSLPADLLRVTEALGLPEEHAEYKKRFPGTTWIPYQRMKGQGEILFISFNGRSPAKEEAFIVAPIPDGKKGTYLLKVALPTFVERPTDIGYIGLTVEPGRLTGRTYPVEDITEIAKKNLDDRIGRITAKAIARATAKYLASREIRKAAGDDPLTKFIAEVGTDIYSLASEQADLRSWRTLPGEIQLARVAVPPGRYTVEAVYHGRGGGAVGRKTFENVVVKAGEKRFIEYRVLGTALPVSRPPADHRPARGRMR
jgi:hypothetical protein